MFETTTAALWAEEVAQNRGIPVEVVPAPAEAEAKCDLALMTFAAQAEELSDALTEEGVAWRPWPPEDREGGTPRH